MAVGIVKWFNAEKGFGFIAPQDGGPDIFVHYTAISTSGFRTLEEGQKVDFEVAIGAKGPAVSRIVPIGEGPLEGPGSGGGDDRPPPRRSR